MPSEVIVLNNRPEKPRPDITRVLWKPTLSRLSTTTKVLYQTTLQYCLHFLAVFTIRERFGYHAALCSSGTSKCCRNGHCSRSYQSESSQQPASQHIPIPHPQRAPLPPASPTPWSSHPTPSQQEIIESNPHSSTRTLSTSTSSSIRIYPRPRLPHTVSINVWRIKAMQPAAYRV